MKNNCLERLLDTICMPGLNKTPELSLMESWRSLLRTERIEKEDNVLGRFPSQWRGKNRWRDAENKASITLDHTSKEFEAVKEIMLSFPENSHYHTDFCE